MIILLTFITAVTSTDVVLIKGCDTIISCVSKYYVHQLQWTGNFNDRFTSIQPPVQSDLSISNVQMDDAGLYVCKDVTNFNDILKTIQVSVIDNTFNCTITDTLTCWLFCNGESTINGSWIANGVATNTSSLCVLNRATFMTSDLKSTLRIKHGCIPYFNLEWSFAQSSKPLYLIFITVFIIPLALLPIIVKYYSSHFSHTFIHEKAPVKRKFNKSDIVVLHNYDYLIPINAYNDIYENINEV